MLEIRLREAMDAYQARTGERLTYDDLADRTGLSRATVESIASRPRYNATLRTLEKLCDALRCEPGELLRLVSNNGSGG